MATHTAQPNVARVPVGRRHRRILIAGLVLLGVSIVAVGLIIALSSGGRPTSPAASQAQVSSPAPNAGPADGTPSTVQQAFGATPPDAGPADDTPSAVQQAFEGAGTPASGITPKISHLAPRVARLRP